MIIDLQAACAMAVMTTYGQAEPDMLCVITVRS